jgi:hypothetical protein
MIMADSRYMSAVLQTVDAVDGPRQEMRVPFPSARQITYTFYRIKAGDRPDTLAAQFFSNPGLWWVIADANPEYLSWNDIPLGASIRIPNA